MEKLSVSTDGSRLIESKRIAEENGVSVALTFSDPFMVSACTNGFEEIIGKGIDLLFVLSMKL